MVVARHRFLQAHGITNHVVESSAIEVNRRRRAKSDGWDVRKGVPLLIRYHQGERQVWRVVQVPSVEAEDQPHHQFLHQQIAEVEAERRVQLQSSTDASLGKVGPWMRLKGMGINGSWLLVREFFGWRELKNRREVGGLAGLTPTPDQSGCFAAHHR